MIRAHALSLRKVHNLSVVTANSLQELGKQIAEKSSFAVMIPGYCDSIIVGNIQLKEWSGNFRLLQYLITPHSFLEANEKPFSFEQVGMPDDFDYVLFMDEDGFRHDLPVNEMATSLFAGKYCNGEHVRGPVAILHKEFVYRSGETEYETDSDDDSVSKSPQEPSNEVLTGHLHWLKMYTNLSEFQLQNWIKKK